MWGEKASGMDEMNEAWRLCWKNKGTHVLDKHTSPLDCFYVSTREPPDVTQVVFFPYPMEKNEFSWIQGKVLDCTTFADHAVIQPLEDSLVAQKCVYLCPLANLVYSRDSCGGHETEAWLWKTFFHETSPYGVLCMTPDLLDLLVQQSSQLVRGESHRRVYDLKRCLFLAQKLLKPSRSTKHVCLDVTDQLALYMDQSAKRPVVLCTVHTTTSPNLVQFWKRVTQPVSIKTDKKAVALILLGPEGWSIHCALIQLLGIECTSPVSSCSERLSSLASVLGVLTQTTHLHSLAAFHYEWVLSENPQCPYMGCRVQLWSDTLHVCCFRGNENSNHCAPPLIYKVLMVLLSLKSLSGLMEMGRHDRSSEDASFALGVLFPLADAAKEQEGCGLLYHQLMRQFAVSGFQKSTVRHLMQMLFVSGFCEASYVYLSCGPQNAVESTRVKLQDCLHRIFRYLQVDLPLNHVDVYWMECLPVICYNLYSGVIHFIMEHFNQNHSFRWTAPGVRHDPQKVPEEFKRTTHLHIFQSMEDDIHQVKRHGHTQPASLSHLIKQCTADSVNQFYSMDMALKDPLMKKKAVESLWVKQYRTIHQKTVVLKLLRQCHHPKTEKDPWLCCGLTELLKMSPRQRHHLYGQVVRFRRLLQEQFLDKLEDDVKRQRFASLRVKKRSQLFALHQSHGQVIYDSSQLYRDNCLGRLPRFLMELFSSSSHPFVSTSLVKMAWANPTSLSSSTCEERLDQLRRILSTCSQRFYVVCLAGTPSLHHGETSFGTNQTQPESHPFGFPTSSPFSYHLCRVATQLMDYSIAQAERHATFVAFSPSQWIQQAHMFFAKNDDMSLQQLSMPQTSTRVMFNMINALGLTVLPHHVSCQQLILPRCVVDFLNNSCHIFFQQVLPACVLLRRHVPLLLAKHETGRAKQSTVLLQSLIRRILFKDQFEQDIHQNPALQLVLGLVVFLGHVLTPPQATRVILEPSLPQISNAKSPDTTHHQAARRIQTWWRRVRAKHQAFRQQRDVILKLAAQHIQAACRRFIAQRQLCQKVQEKNNVQAAILIQKSWRAWSQRRRFSSTLLLRVAIVPIKRLTSRFILVQHRLHMLALLKKKKNIALRSTWRLNAHATTIQKCWRRHFVQSQYLLLRHAALHCQTVLLTSLHRSRHVWRIKKIIFLQRFFRAYWRLRPFSTLFRPSTSSFSTARRLPGNIWAIQDAPVTKEYKAFRLAHFPLLFYQGVLSPFSSPLAHAPLPFLPLYFKIDKLPTNGYRHPWWWTCLRLLHYYARISWNHTVHQTWDTPAITWSSIMRSSMSRLRVVLSGSIDLSTLPRHLLALLTLLTEWIPLLRVQAIALGKAHTLLILAYRQDLDPPTTTRGPSTTGASSLFVSRVFSWGANHRGQLGISKCSPHPSTSGSSSSYLAPLQFSHVASPQKETTGIPRYLDDSLAIKSIAAGDDFSVALTKHGRLFTWGDNQLGQCGHGSRYTCFYQPTLLQHLQHLVIHSLAVSSFHVLCVATDHSAYVWGKRELIALDHLASTQHFYTPVRLPLETWCNDTCRQVFCGKNFNVMTFNRRCGSVLFWGSLPNKFSTTAQVKHSPLHHTIPHVQLIKVVSSRLSALWVSCGSDFAVVCVESETPQAFLWGIFDVFIQTPQALSSPKRNTPVNQFLRFSNKKNTASGSTKKIKPLKRLNSLRYIPHPTLLTHVLWKNAKTLRAVGGCTSNVTINVDDQYIYAFDFVQPQMDSEASESFTPQETFSQNTSFPHTPHDQDKNKTLYPPILHNVTCLTPALYQYKSYRHALFTTHQIACTFNSAGMQLNFAFPKTNLHLKDNQTPPQQKTLSSLQHHPPSSTLATQQHTSDVYDHILKLLTPPMQSQAIALAETFLGPLHSDKTHSFFS